MKVTKRIISLILCFAMILSMGITGVSAEQTNNLLVNADFELGSGTPGKTTSTIDGWEKSNGGWMNNNEHGGEYGFYLNTSNAYIQQTVEIPVTTTYMLSAWLAGKGIISVSYEGGEEIASQTHGVDKYDEIVFSNLELKAGDRITVKVVPNGGWINGDDFIFTTAGAYDEVFIQAVINRIDALGTITASSKVAIEAARAAYEDLSDENKAQVTNYDELVAAEQALAAILAQQVVDKIDAIGEVTASSSSAISAARSAYEALNDAAKALVSNYQTLVKAENALSLVKSKDVMAMIDELGEITADSRAAVLAARDAYDKLTAKQKEQVLNLPVLEAAEEVLAELGLYIERRMTPIMGWSSWNEYNVEINDQLFYDMIDAMVELGLVDAGYTYFNIDDGYQGGRDEETGLVVSNPEKFPDGMKVIADYAHEHGMKAGIYSDCGYNTCASVSHGQGTDPSWYTGEAGNGYGLGVGLYGNWYEDMYQYFIDWGYDFIKIDWCGGRDFQPQALDQETEYTRISGYIDQMELIKGEDIIYNVCCWKFPGEWVTDVADSWRSGGDIQANFNSVLGQLDAVAALAEYHGPGHVHDMDMLQVGRGMTVYEDMSHFGMWCMLSVPLVLGHDVTTTSAETLEIITNEELIAIDQDPAVIMAEVVWNKSGVQLWEKPLGSEDSNVKAIALLNRNNYDSVATVNWSDVGFSGDVQVRDLWTHEDLVVGDSYTVTLPAHGCAILKVSGDATISDAVIKATEEDMPLLVNLEGEGTLDWADLSKNTEKDGAFVINAESNSQVSLKSVTTGRVAKFYIAGAAIVTATLDGKQVTEPVSGPCVYEIEYAGELNGTDLVVTVEGSHINAVTVADAEGAINATNQLLATATEAEVDVTEAEEYVSFDGTSAEGTLFDYATAAGAEISNPGAVQFNVHDYFELYLPASATLTKAQIPYAICNGSATVTIDNGEITEKVDLYDISGGTAETLTVWYTAAEDVRVRFELDSTFAEDTFLSVFGIGLTEETAAAVMDSPVVTEEDGVLTITANTLGTGTVPMTAEIFTADGTRVAEEAIPVIVDGDVKITIEIPADFETGTLKVRLSSGDAYEIALPIVDETIPEEIPNIGNLLAKELLADGGILVDTRSVEEFEEGHIEGAINIPYNTILENAPELLTDKDQNIVVYCSAGKRSAQAQMALMGMGYTSVHNIGAMSNWYIEPNIALTEAVDGMKEGDQFAVVFTANPYEEDLVLYCSMGKDSTFEDAKVVPASHMVSLTGDGWVKAYLTYKGEVILTKEVKMPLLVNLEIPEWDVDVYMTELEWTTNTSDWKAANKNKSIEGRTLTIAGNTFDNGIGAHAVSHIVAEIPEGMNRFVAVAGADDEVATSVASYDYADMQFAVYIDGQLMEQSMIMPFGYYYIFDVTFPVGSKTIELVIDKGGDGVNCDHGDWGVAGFIAATQEEIDAAAAEKVMNKIEALGEITSLEQEAAVVAAREAYEALTEEQKDLVGEEFIAALEAAEAAIEELKKPVENPFEDVAETEYYFDPVMWAVKEGITAGTSATTFEPEKGCTRAQVVTFLWRAAGEPTVESENPFTDVPATEYYYNAVLWAVSEGITQGTDPGVFSPEDVCTRAQIVTFLYRFAGEPEVESENPFQDVDAVEYYYNPVLWAVNNGITQGTDPGVFSPEDVCTRAQIVTFLYRYIAK